MTIIDGKALAKARLDDIAVQVCALGASPHLAAVCAGDDPGLRSFVKLKQKAAQSVGIQFSSYFFESNDQDGARQMLEFLANDETVDGIFVELPLPASPAGGPESWDTDAFLALIPAEKDVDALTNNARIPEPAVRALQYVLCEYNIDMRGKRATVVGNGRLIGKPIARWLSEQGADVSAVDIDTKNPEAIACIADLVVTGVGKSGLVTGDWIKEGATVIDFGFSRSTGSGQAGGGDVDLDSVQKKAGLLSPVPGGMGPLVIAAVLENLVELI